MPLEGYFSLSSGRKKNSASPQTVGVCAYLLRLYPPTTVMLSAKERGLKNKAVIDFERLIFLSPA
jgi:hypothetical protein